MTGHQTGAGTAQDWDAVTLCDRKIATTAMTGHQIVAGTACRS